MHLATYLRQMGQTQTEFARRHGFKVTTLHGWTSGRRAPRAAAIAVIEHATKGAVRAQDLVEKGETGATVQASAPQGRAA